MPRTNERIFRESGAVRSNDRLVLFLYLLLRDHLPAGIVEKIAETACAVDASEHDFTNGWLADYAMHIAVDLKKKGMPKEQQ